MTHGLQAEKATLAKQAGGAVDGKKGEKDEYAQATPQLLRQSNAGSWRLEWLNASGALARCQNYASM